jgi:hypothetical protein
MLVTVKVLRKDGCRDVKVDPAVSEIAQIPDHVATVLEALDPPAVARIGGNKMTNGDSRQTVNIPPRGYALIKNAAEGEK